jgi:hypothetical protein
MFLRPVATTWPRCDNLPVVFDSGVFITAWPVEWVATLDVYQGDPLFKGR